MILSLRDSSGECRRDASTGGMFRSRGGLNSFCSRVTPLHNYVERFPHRGTWTPAAEPPPPFSFTIQVLLPDGKTTHGTWTGAVWWRAGEEVQPVGWRWVADFGLSQGPRQKTAQCPGTPPVICG